MSEKITSEIFVSSLPKTVSALQERLKFHRDHQKLISHIASTQKHSVLLSVVLVDGETCSIPFYPDGYPGFPPELQLFLEQYSSRLIAEQWLIEDALEDAKKNK